MARLVFFCTDATLDCTDSVYGNSFDEILLNLQEHAIAHHAYSNEDASGEDQVAYWRTAITASARQRRTLLVILRDESPLILAMTTIAALVALLVFVVVSLVNL